MTYKEAKSKAEKYDKNLKADDPRFGHAVKIMMEDGSIFFWKDAFVLEDSDWVHVFTEHYGTHTFDVDEIKNWEMFELTGGTFFSW